jgi:hypothetical protein
MPAPDGGDDLVRVLRPAEVVQQKGRGSALASSMRRSIAPWGATREWSTPRLSRRRVSLAKKPSTASSQDAGVGVKLEDEAGVPAEPPHHLGVLVGGVVVEDDVDHLACGHLGLDGVEDADELLVLVALYAAADDRAFRHVEGGDQGVRAIRDAVVRHGAAARPLQRQAGPGAVERLNLALLVHRQDDRVRGRIGVVAGRRAGLRGRRGELRDLPRRRRDGAGVARAGRAGEGGVSLAAPGAWVIATTVWHAVHGTLPSAGTMGVVGVLALAANSGVAVMLPRWRGGDANMRSVWIFSRNEAIGNVAVGALLSGAHRANAPARSAQARRAPTIGVCEGGSLAGKLCSACSSTRRSRAAGAPCPAAAAATASTASATSPGAP